MVVTSERLISSIVFESLSGMSAVNTPSKKRVQYSGADNNFVIWSSHLILVKLVILIMIIDITLVATLATISEMMVMDIKIAKG